MVAIRRTKVNTTAPKKNLFENNPIVNNDSFSDFFLMIFKSTLSDIESRVFRFCLSFIVFDDFVRGIPRKFPIGKSVLLQICIRITSS